MKSVSLVLGRAFLKPPLVNYGFRAPSIHRFDSMEKWTDSRLAEVPQYWQLFESFTNLKGQTVLELGCNRGYLLKALLEKETFNAIGADISEADLKIARDTCPQIRFVRSTPTSVPIDSESIDVCYTIDTVEHLSKTPEMFNDIFRVLKPRGLFLVHFNPWLNPYGSHLEDIIPFPWPHVVFSMETLLDTAEVLYEEQSVEKTAAYFREKDGQKVPNPYRDRAKWETFLNKMTIHRFNRMLANLPFEVVHQECIGFGGKTFRAGRLLRGLADVPVLREFFTNALFTVLRKP